MGVSARISNREPPPLLCAETRRSRDERFRIWLSSVGAIALPRKRPTECWVSTINPTAWVQASAGGTGRPNAMSSPLSVPPDSLTIGPLAYHSHRYAASSERLNSALMRISLKLPTGHTLMLHHFAPHRELS
jgi:hypothetical protein